MNIDPVESDLTPVAPQELVAMATGSAGATATGGSLERPDLTPADVEKKQTVWWFLLFAGAAAVFSEASLANRLSRKLRRCDGGPSSDGQVGRSEDRRYNGR